MISTQHNLKRSAFTLVELLVVIAVIGVTLGALVPSVSRIIQSTNYSSAVNTVTATLGRARAAAMESGRPTAVAFLFDIKTQRYTIQVLELAQPDGDGSIAIGSSQSNMTSNGGEGLRPVGVSNAIAAYWPLQYTAPIELPPGTAVFGFSQQLPALDLDGNNPPLLDQYPNGRDGRIDPIAEETTFVRHVHRWYAGEVLNDGNGDPDDNILPWIFPRNDPRVYVDEGVDPWAEMASPSGDLQRARAAVRNAMSFAVAFRPDGSTSSLFGNDHLDAYIEYPNDPLDDEADENRPYDAPTQFDPGVTHPNNIRLTRPNPEVRLRTVNLLAVVDLRALQAGANVDRPWLVRASGSEATGSSLLPYPNDANDPKRRYINNEMVERMSNWIDRNAQILSFNRYTGATVKR